MLDISQDSGRSNFIECDQHAQNILFLHINPSGAGLLNVA